MLVGTPADVLFRKGHRRRAADPSGVFAGERNVDSESRWRALSSAAHDPRPLHPQADQDLRLGPGGAQERRPRDPQGRDLRAARPERRRQDHADQHRLRHRHADRRARCWWTATTSCATIGPRGRRSAWCRRSSPPTRSRRVWATVSFSRGLFGRAPNPRIIEKAAARSVAVGQARRPAS